MGKIDLKKSHEVTAKLAYELWERRGCPIGSPEVDWFEAEQALQVEQTNSNQGHKQERERKRGSKP